MLLRLRLAGLVRCGGDVLSCTIACSRSGEPAARPSRAFSHRPAVPFAPTRAARSSSTAAGPGSKPPHPSLAATPPAPPSPPHTAASWLARSPLTHLAHATSAPPHATSAPLPRPLIDRLFRARAVRAVGAGGGARPRRAAAGMALQPGDRVLVPASALAGLGERRRAPDPAAPPSPATVALGALLARRVLLALPAAPGGGFLILNKPAGVRVQGGGGGGGPTLDAAARAGLRAAPAAADDPGGEDGVPRLVHRLDAGASGCLALATGRPAAAWLAEAFAAPAALEDGRGGSSGSGGTSGGGSSRSRSLRHLPPGRGPAVTKTYWALVDGAPYGDLPDPAAGRKGSGWGPVTHVGPLPLAPHSPRGVGAYAAALDDVRGTGPPPAQTTATWWRVLAARGGRAWLELRPLTGRKHQLRRVAAGPPLGAPVVGDDRYGAVRSPRARALAAAVEARAPVPTPPGALFLHCSSLRVRLPGGQGAVRAAAPAPPHLRAALEGLGWGRLLDAKEHGGRRGRVWGRGASSGGGQRRLAGAPRAGRRRL